MLSLFLPSCLPAFFSLFSESIALELRGGGKVRSLWRLALFLQLAACFPSAPEEEGRGDGMKDLKVGKNHRRHINTDRGALTDARAGIKTMKESSDSLLALSKEEEKER